MTQSPILSPKKNLPNGFAVMKPVASPLILETPDGGGQELVGNIIMDIR